MLWLWPLCRDSSEWRTFSVSALLRSSFGTPLIIIVMLFGEPASECAQIATVPTCRLETRMGCDSGLLQTRRHTPLSARRRLHLDLQPNSEAARSGRPAGARARAQGGPAVALLRAGGSWALPGATLVLSFQFKLKVWDD
jgi:hypothetical protein